MKVLIYGYGSHALFMKEVIRESEGTGIEWSIILPSYHFLEDFAELLDREKILYFHGEMNSAMKKEYDPTKTLATYSGHIYRDLAAEKFSLSKKEREFQIKYACASYNIHKEFIGKIKPDMVVFPSFQDSDALILFNICRELGIEPVFYVHARSFGVSFFSPTPDEDLPIYASTSKVRKDDLERAEKFLQKFRKEHSFHFQACYTPMPEEVIGAYGKPFFQRATSFFSSLLENKEPYNFQRDFGMRLRTNLFSVTRAVRKAKARLSEGVFDIYDLEELPEKFIYYPLHYTPEATINIPAPFFVDQLRVIDAVRFGMPSDHVLVIKEHKSMAGIRPTSFYKQAKNRPGVILAHYSLPAKEIIPRSSLTVSVTGTSCLEAMLYGKPSMHLGHAFFTDWIYWAKHHDLRDDIKKALSREVEDSDIVAHIASLFSVSNNSFVTCPSSKYRDTKYVMNKANIKMFLDGLLDHYKRTNMVRSKKK